MADYTFTGTGCTCAYINCVHISYRGCPGIMLGTRIVFAQVTVVNFKHTTKLQSQHFFCKFSLLSAYLLCVWRDSLI